jgi:hypothetical protein
MSTAILYKAPPNREKAAAREIERQGINAIVPWDETGKRARVTAPGYVFAGSAVDTSYTKHVRQRMGAVSIADIAAMYIRKPERRSDAENPFEPGQKALKGDIPVTVVHVSGRLCRIEWDMLGKRQTQSIHYSQLRPG